MSCLLAGMRRRRRTRADAVHAVFAGRLMPRAAAGRSRRLGLLPRELAADDGDGFVLDDS